jgi:hypothetical protein
MRSLMKNGLAFLVLSLAAGHAGAIDSPSFLAMLVAQQGQAALTDLQGDIEQDLREHSRTQLNHTLPAELAACATLSAPAVAATSLVAAHRSPLRDLLGLRRSGTASADGERGSLRWQSLLPGMMK